MFGYRSILTEAPRPEAIRRNPRAPWLAVGVVCFGAFMGQLDASIVTLTFRPMEHQFAEPLAAVQWVSLGYLLALVAMLAPAGRLADGIGRKLVYGFGFVIFTLGSAACGLAPALGLLVVFRLVQAGGAAMLQANSVALVTTCVPAPKMRLALGIQAAAQSVGLGLGPTLGGLITRDGRLARGVLDQRSGRRSRRHRRPLPAAADQAVRPDRRLRLAGRPGAGRCHQRAAAGPVGRRRPARARLGGRRTRVPGGAGRLAVRAAGAPGKVSAYPGRAATVR